MRCMRNPANDVPVSRISRARASQRTVAWCSRRSPRPRMLTLVGSRSRIAQPVPVIRAGRIAPLEPLNIASMPRTSSGSRAGGAWLRTNGYHSLVAGSLMQKPIHAPARAGATQATAVPSGSTIRTISSDTHCSGGEGVPNTGILLIGRTLPHPLRDALQPDVDGIVFDLDGIEAKPNTRIRQHPAV